MPSSAHTGIFYIMLTFSKLCLIILGTCEFLLQAAVGVLFSCMLLFLKTSISCSLDMTTETIFASLCNITLDVEMSNKISHFLL